MDPGWSTHEHITKRHSAGNADTARPEDARVEQADARLCDYHTCPACLCRFAARRRRFALSGAPPDGTAGMAEVRVGRHGKEPGGALLFPYREGEDTAVLRVPDRKGKPPCPGFAG